MPLVSVALPPSAGVGSRREQPWIERGGALQRLFQDPPGIWFHAVVAAAWLPLLWAVSVPGFDLLGVLVGLAGVGVVAAAGAVWVARIVPCLVLRSPGRRSLRWLVVAPVIVVVALAAVIADMPLRARWVVARPAFERAVAEAPAGSDPEVPGRIGTYRIEFATRVGAGIVFYEAHGALFDFAGFAYLPDGPTDEIRLLLHGGEVGDYRHLGGGWYAFTHSW